MNGSSPTSDPTQEPASANLRIRLERTMQIFNTLDPYPFTERDLDPAAEDYLVSWAKELPKDQRLKIEVLVPLDEAATPQARDLPQAVARYFEERRRQIRQDLKELFRIGRTSLLIGILILGTCLLLAQTIASLYPDNRFASIMTEGFVIAGWVANWRPIEIFLYDWWPLLRQRDLFTRLAQAKLVVIADPTSNSPST